MARVRTQRFYLGIYSTSSHCIIAIKCDANICIPLIFCIIASSDQAILIFKRGIAGKNEMRSGSQLFELFFFTLSGHQSKNTAVTMH